MKYFSKEHEWISVDEDANIGVVGITKYAVDQLGDITYVELPEIDEEVKQYSAVCSIESVKAASDIYTPVSGKIIEINETLEDSPEIVNQSPEEEGWIFKIELINKNELKNLMNEEEYQNYIKGL